MLTKNIPPTMSHKCIMERAEAKRIAILKFLSDGEVWTITDVALQVMKTNRTSALSTLQRLEKNGSLKSETHAVSSRVLRIWGITPHGAALVNSFDTPTFESGRISSGGVNHHLDTQRARISAEMNGWKNWTPGKLLFNQGLRKVPDAICTDPSGKIIAVEIERTIKSRKRYAEILSAYLQEIKCGKFDQVHYISPSGHCNAVESSIKRIRNVTVAGGQVELQENHWARFEFFNLVDWPCSQSPSVQSVQLSKTGAY